MIIAHRRVACAAILLGSLLAMPAASQPAIDANAVRGFLRHAVLAIDASEFLDSVEFMPIGVLLDEEGYLELDAADVTVATVDGQVYLVDEDAEFFGTARVVALDNYAIVLESLDSGERVRLTVELRMSPEAYREHIDRIAGTWVLQGIGDRDYSRSDIAVIFHPDGEMYLAPDPMAALDPDHLHDVESPVLQDLLEASTAFRWAPSVGAYEVHSIVEDRLTTRTVIGIIPPDDIFGSIWFIEHLDDELLLIQDEEAPGVLIELRRPR